MGGVSSLLAQVRWWLDDRLPEPRQKRLAVVMAAAVILCGGWILVFAVGTIARASSGSDAGAVPESPMVKAGQAITLKLRDEGWFAEVSVRPHVDYPDKLRVSGQVSSDTDLAALKQRLSELDPARAFVVEVKVTGSGG